MDDYEQAQHDYYDAVRGENPGGTLDESKGDRYVKGWNDAEAAFNQMGRPSTIEEFKARASQLAREQQGLF
jgi:hypothetical protein